MKTKFIQDSDVTENLKDHYLHISSEKYEIDIQGDFLDYEKDDSSTTIKLNTGKVKLPLNHLQDYTIKAYKNADRELSINNELDRATKEFLNELKEIQGKIQYDFLNLTVKKIGKGYSSKDVQEDAAIIDKIFDEIIIEIHNNNKAHTTVSNSLNLALDNQIKFKTKYTNIYDKDEVLNILNVTKENIEKLYLNTNLAYTDILFTAIDN